MMAGNFQDFSLEKAEQLSARLREVLSSGQAYILTRFGVDLGLDPDLYPTWIVLSGTAGVLLLLLLLLALSWAAVRGAPLLGKAPTSRVDQRSCEPDKADLAKPSRAEEQRKRNKKKPPEKVRTALAGDYVREAPSKQTSLLFVTCRSSFRQDQACVFPSSICHIGSIISPVCVKLLERSVRNTFLVVQWLANVSIIVTFRFVYTCEPLTRIQSAVPFTNGPSFILSTHVGVK